MSKVKVELSSDTIHTLEKAKNLLSQHENFTWIKHLPLDGFIDFLFGTSDLAKYSRQVLNEVLKVEEPVLPKPSNPKGYYRPHHAEIIKLLLKEKVPLNVAYMAEKLGKTTIQMKSLLKFLRDRGIVRKKGYRSYFIDEDTLKQYALKKTIKERIYEVLKGKKLTMKQIVKAIPDENPQSVDAEVYHMKSKGLIIQQGEYFWLK